MRVEFVTGPAGSGKTRWCLDHVVAMLRERPLGDDLFWLVPSQSTFMTERLLATDARLGGFARCRVVDFDKLGEVILACTGHAAVPQVDRLGRQMLIARLLRRHTDALRYFAGSSRQLGLAAELDEAFGEFETAGQTAQDIAASAAALDATDMAAAERDVLRAKLEDLALLYEAYRQRLGEDRLDPFGRRKLIEEAAAECPELRNATVLVDGFNTFTAGERRVLAAVAKVAAFMAVTFKLPPTSLVPANPDLLPSDTSVFRPVELSYRSLHFALKQAGVPTPKLTRLPAGRRFANGALRLLAERAQQPDAVRPIDAERANVTREDLARLTLIETADRPGECEAAARALLRWRDAGIPWREMAVLGRDLTDHEPYLRAAFVEHEIPFFIDARRPASHHPLTRLVRSLLGIVQRNWPHDAVMTLVKTGLTPLSLDDADTLENYVLTHRIRHAAWSAEEDWAYHRKYLAEDEPEPRPLADRSRHADALRRQLVTALAPLAALRKQTAPLADFASAALAAMDRLKVTQHLGALIDAETSTERREEHEGLFNALCDMLQQLVDVLGEEAMGFDEFAAVLEAGLDRFDLAITPPTLDEVLVGSLDRTRTPALQAVVLLGMNEGEFPRNPSEGGILGDAERDVLHAAGVELDESSVGRLFNETFLGYVALTRAGERLCLVRRRSDESRELSPGLFWRLVAGTFSIQPLQFGLDPLAQARAIGNKRQFAAGLLRWAATGADTQEPAGRLAAALYDAVARGDVPEPVAAYTQAQWPALRYQNQPRLKRTTAERLFPSPLKLSVSQLESFAVCPYRHFLRYGLRLMPRPEPDLGARELGSAYHGVLERVVRAVIETGGDWAAAADQLPDTIANAADDVGRALEGQLMLASARNRYMLGRARRDTAVLCTGQTYAQHRGKFKPASAEFSFGQRDGQIPPLAITTPDGRLVLLRGRIDRIDATPEGAVAVIDYKLGRGKKFDLAAAYHGLALQLLTYLVVLSENELPGLGRVTPIAAFFAPLRPQVQSVTHPEELPELGTPEMALRDKPRGIFGLSAACLLDDTLQHGDASLVMSFKLNKDGKPAKTGDWVEDDALQLLLAHAKRCIGNLADRIFEGDVSLEPVRLGRNNMLGACDFTSVYRFDLEYNGYMNLESYKPDAVFAAIREDAAWEGAST
ncbi:MAG: PD-(D/E)XK nuclease family protein [Phycisphaerae bacterium]